jgi:SlyX protein
MSENRLAEIEIKLTYLEDTVQELNTLAYQQQSRITHLEKLCTALAEHIRGLSEPASSRAFLDEKDEKPPHY